MSQHEEAPSLYHIQEELDAQGKMIRRIDRRMRYATYGSVLKWLVYAGLALGAFVWLKPYLEAITATAQKIQEGAGVVTNFKQSFADSWRDAWDDFLGSFTGGTTTDAKR